MFNLGLNVVLNVVLNLGLNVELNVEKIITSLGERAKQWTFGQYCESRELLNFQQ